MIYTITFNPSIDYFVNLDCPLEEGRILRAVSSAVHSGGKGINISQNLSSLGIPSKAVVFLGGFTGKKISHDLLLRNNIEVLSVNIREDNRINVKITNGKETAINAQGPLVTADEIKQFLQKLENVRKDDYVVISGSFCRGTDKSVVSRIADIAHEKGARLVIDQPMLKLQDYRETRPYLIKPNLEELESIFDTEIGKDEYEGYVDQLIDDGVENVLLSLGAEGCFFANSREKYQATGPEITPVNTVGSGDTMLAYTLAALSTGKSFREAVKYGEAAGRAKTAMDSLPGPDDVRKMYEKVKIRKR